MKSNKKCLYLLDGNSLTHRAFYALPPMNNPEGLPTNAVFGFTRMLLKLMKDEKPDFLAVAFDLKAPTFRHMEYSAYKGTRDKTPDELVPQFELVRNVLRAFDIPIFTLEGFEADDLLGTLAKAGEEQGHSVTIVTGDRDALQLVSDNIRVMYNKRGITDIEDYNLPAVRDKYGVEPVQLIDVKGLMGDSSDNIPGVPGIGEKTALALIQQFGSLETVLESIDQVSGKKRQETLRDNTEQALLSKRLATIDTRAPIEIDFARCVTGEPDYTKVVEVFTQLGFRSLVDQFTLKNTVEVARIAYQTLQSDEEIANVIHNLSTTGPAQKAGPVNLFAPASSELPDTGQIKLELVLSAEDPMRSEITGLLFAGSDATAIYHLPVKGSLPEPLVQMLTDAGVSKTLYQAKAQMVALRRYGVELQGLAFDPDLAVYLLRPSEKNPNWTEIVSEYLNMTLPAGSTPVDTAALRISLLPQLEEVFRAQLAESGLDKLFKEIEIPLEEVLAEMEFNGIDLDEPYLRQLSGELGSRIEAISKEICEIAGFEFNISSPKQLGEVLFEKLNMPVIKKTKTGYATGVEVLEELEKYDTTGIIQMIYEYRELTKLKSTYVDALPPLVHPETGRIHTYFNQTVTATGRLSSTEPNLQNIPIRTEEGRKIRAAFIAGGDDTVLLTADYSQVELRVLAHISHDPGLVEAFQTNADIHTRTAAEVFDLPPDKVDKEHRRRAKAINFGIAYGQSPFGLSKELGIPIKEAENYIDRYFTRYRGVKEYIANTIEEAKAQGYVVTLEKRRRYLQDINSRNFHLRSFAERMAINTPIQGTAADIMKIAMIKVYRALKAGNYRSRLLLQVHDELVLEVYEDEVQEIAGLIRQEMEGAYELAVPLLVDVETGKNWLVQESFFD